MALRLKKQQRDELAYLKWKKCYSWREIWEIMKVDFTVLYKEYKRNKKRWGVYDSKLAQQKTYQRNHYKKKECKTIRMYNVLEDYILKHLEWWWSSETIAWRWNKIDKYLTEYSLKIILPKITWITIRRYIHSKYGYWIKDYMTHNKLLKRVKKKQKHEKRKGWNIQHRVFIDSRPLICSYPTTIWHFECDFIVSKKWDNAVIMTLIDKFSRFKIAVKLPSRDSIVVFNTLKELIKKYHIISITFDNDLWFALHYKLWINSYFCHTYSSREKWQVERGNRSYRIFFPKWTELSQITQEEIDKVSEILNNTPMKCLNYQTPKEVWEKEIKRNNEKITVVSGT